MVRFYDISSDDFLLKIYPFKELLPNDLINNIFAFHTAPNNKLNIKMHPPRRAGLVIINYQHLNIFAGWIDKKTFLYYNKVICSPYRFKLLYRASKDGFTTTAFHEKWDNKGAIIVVAKVKNSEHIIGGYNP